MLVVDDNDAINRGLKHFFERGNYEVVLASTGTDALAQVATPPGFDVLLLDVRLPDIDGFEVLRQIRARGLRVPTLLISAHGNDELIVRGLETGAADFVPKPFSARELRARVEAILSRTLPPARQPMEIRRLGDVEVNFSTHEVRRGDEPIGLTALEFELLHYLFARQGETVTRDELLRHVWKTSDRIVTRTIDRHVASLRKKVEPVPSAPRHLITVYGKGYKLDAGD